MPAMHMLIVDDIAQNIDLLSLLLTRSGHQVTIARDGQEALSKMQDDSIDIVLMDLQMPIMDGYEATKILRSWGYSQPIVAFSAHAMTEEKEKALSSGFSSYLSKPVTQSELINRINEVIDQRPSS